MYMKNMTKNSFRPDKEEFGLIESKEELRSVVAIFRHGDRTPKQKMKMKSSFNMFLSFFEDQCKDITKEAKIKHPK